MTDIHEALSSFHLPQEQILEEHENSDSEEVDGLIAMKPLLSQIDNSKGEDILLEDNGNDIKIQAASKAIRVIYSVIFDKNTGPVVEWQYPKSLNLDGIEFSSLASGLHDTTGPDLVYFVISAPKRLYGMCVYRRHMMKGQSSRDVVMRSVGVLCDHFAFLYQHRQYLEEFTEKIKKHQLEKEEKQELKSYLKSHNEEIPANPMIPSLIPTGAFNYLFSIFGPYMFTLWKAILLKKRILICSNPPVKVISLLTYAASFLSYHSVKSKKWKDLHSTSPLFYVNVSTPEGEFSRKKGNFIACTTEKIFERKAYVYDVFVDIKGDEGDDLKPKKKKVSFHVNKIEDEITLKLTNGDKARYQFVSSFFQAADESRIINFMKELNNLFLNSIEKVKGRVITPEDMDVFGLKSDDVNFFEGFIETHDLPIVIKYPKCWCC